MDDIDGAILRELQRDGRMSMAELGSQLGIAPSTVFKRIEKLKNAGIIERFTIVINQKCFEHTLIAFLNVRVTPEKKTDVEAFMMELPSVLELYEVLEPGDFFVKVRVQSITELKREVLIPLSGLAGVRDIQTIIAVRKVKEQVQNG
ncbi:Lrp/AsnC family transcriptional regulator [Methanoculleus sp. FWC-SCC1]|uniref:Lrp/AsnC family transcriptional regulator n=1 Tax=Methanoculleus frigidifontis TaxID=2584085 RepID=A0ABT8M6J7_9EURY|nr:Lrp/AsnC family transcriptional regulator [Methanoculleus sp. FWC-SCC1]MDN7023561.1 Lrp/AsnC family transcriptional regulator [Methanoculleus sp. FWC-SCC1]